MYAMAAVYVSKISLATFAKVTYLASAGTLDNFGVSAIDLPSLIFLTLSTAIWYTRNF